MLPQPRIKWNSQEADEEPNKAHPHQTEGV